ncbi:MAG: acetyl-CoA carboxylase biotin carboxyl carrier protein [Gammaproteobacteria bacterium]
MEIKEIRELIDLINETGVAEIEIRKGEEAVRITRQNMQIPHFTTTIPVQPEHIAQPMPQASHPTEQSNLPAGHLLKAPMVGTAYLSPNPESKPFVEIGQTVSAGDILCIIEAMKMFNQIEADKSGKISARLIENGQPVEFDQPLFIIE